MYENDKYNILRIRNHPGPQFEVVVHWLSPVNKIEHVFFNDNLLEDDKFIDHLDIIWEENYNKGTPVEQASKITKLDDARKKYIKKEKEEGGN